MQKQSIKGAVRAAKQDDTRARRALTKGDLGGGATLSAATADSFVNFAHKLGVGADNALTSGTYGFNPLTRNRTQLEWIHRGSWLGGVAVDIVADDMTRAGVDFITELEPGDGERIEQGAQELGMWDAFNEAIKWGRLYGGCLVIALVDGQDPRTPLRLETVGPEQFKGFLVLDRWMVSPSLEDLVTDYGPFLGTPKYYRVEANAPAMKGQAVHYTRIMGRFVGIDLPYQQRLTENLWGISVLERLFDRMIAFDSASTGAAQLVFKSHLRTLSVEGMREIVAAGNKPMAGLLAYTEMMRRFQGLEGMTLIDAADKFEVQSTSAFSGVNSVIDKLGEQLAGALQIPLTRLFGQSPGGLGSNGKGEERVYYDGIRQKQRKQMSYGVRASYRMIAQSLGVALPDDFALDFSSLYELDDVQKAEVASKIAATVQGAKDAGLISDQVALRELRQSSRTTGIFTNITEELIDAADDMVSPPLDEQQLALGAEQAQNAHGLEEKKLEVGVAAADDGAAREEAAAKAEQEAPVPPGGRQRKKLRA